MPVALKIHQFDSSWDTYLNYIEWPPGGGQVLVLLFLFLYLFFLVIAIVSNMTKLYIIVEASYELR